ncbi:Hsp70 family protein [Amycolatopsis sp., V23-08]|uniref:Hsp70 family protein n=1 Tax=Amycolatopsis heterodermiae TaxID=3110235 RepID=A0ABU5RHF2_9PSEU|nr:Hsp70 family protein [Amycolatopsis sp., V23-08]MEA5365270.1 Hsp70 family protein [Amycolatopsis sp., V23-08]
MAGAAGIDPGTTNAVVAIRETGAPRIVPGPEGARTVAGFTGSGDRLVGRQAIRHHRGSLHSAKRFIGRTFDEVPGEAEAVGFAVAEGAGGVVRFDVRGEPHSPEEISAQVLRTRAEDAGLTAAAPACGLHYRRHETVPVFDLGGGTFDVSLLDVGDGDFDRRLVDFLADGFASDNGIDPRRDAQALRRLFEAAEKAEVELSPVARTRADPPFITGEACGPKHLTTTVRRTEFERITAVRSLVRRLTGGKDPNPGVDPDEVVALDVTPLRGRGRQPGARGHPAGTRGEPRIEVTFDVTAHDKDTGTEQGITITECSDRGRCEIDAGLDRV